MYICICISIIVIKITIVVLMIDNNMIIGMPGLRFEP